ncbi:AAEL015114-PA [Aedes aegypti]|uniref:AAEL015114-PA n=1 Tax=Aedes aegypti TaxID=7159 RepID=Q16EK8_AEDAE|nr:AAEL015114-PA [Aedes aegypti]
MDLLVTSTGIVILLTIVIHPVPSSALLCRQCFSLIGWEDCERAARDNLCTAQGVSSSHQGWLHDNPSLLVGNHSRFSCFKYVALVNRHNDKGLVKAYGRGCTFAINDFCEGWKPSVAVKSCNVCSDRDMCNGGFRNCHPSIGIVSLLLVSALMYQQ